MSASLRAKRFIVQYGWFTAILLALVGLASVAGAAYVYTNPPTEQVTEQRNVQEVSSSVRTSAVVTGNTPLYESGRRLVDQPAYLLAATPNLTLAIQTAVPEGQAVTISHRLTLQFTASRNGQSFWASTRVLIAEQQTVRDGELTSETTVNMSEVNQFSTQRREQVGEIGEFQSQVVLNITYDTGDYSGKLTQSTPVVFASNAYWLEGDLSASRTHSETVSRQTTGQPNLGASLGLGVIGITALSGAALIMYLRRQDIDVREIDREISESEFEEWISQGQVPTDPDRKYINIASLEDLVDIAIDSGKRVIHDPEYDVYTVADGDIVYYFARGDFPVESWLNM